jgi:hypothetical protein
MGFRLVIRYTDVLQLITTRNDYALTLVHISQITGRCLTAASNDAHSISSGFSTVPGIVTVAARNSWNPADPLSRNFFYPEDGGHTVLRNVSAYNKPTRHHIPEDGIRNSHRRKNLKSYSAAILFQYSCVETE